jgi:hypothetical protein
MFLWLGDLVGLLLVLLYIGLPTMMALAAVILAGGSAKDFNEVTLTPRVSSSAWERFRGALCQSWYWLIMYP